MSEPLSSIDGPPRRVFISYAHDDDTHRGRVQDLWALLRSCGIDAQIDLVATERRQDWALWMADQIREADHILVIASPEYRQRAQGQGSPQTGRGVQWEARLIRDAFYRDQRSLNRFLPVVLPGQTLDGLPDFLAAATSTVYRVKQFTVAGAASLLRVLTGQPVSTEPPLGPRPALSTQQPAPSSQEEAGTVNASDGTRCPAVGALTQSTPGKYTVDARGATNVQIGDGNTTTIHG